MFIRGTHITVPPDKVDAVIEHFRDETAPKFREVAGNVGAILLIDRTNGDGWGLTYWKDEAALTASEDTGSALRGKVVEQFGVKVQEVDRLEIVVQERAALPRAGTFVRLNDIKGDPQRIDEATRFTLDSIVPRIRGQKGFVSLVTGVNRKSGRGITGTTWATREDLEASEAAAAPMRQEAVAKTGAAHVDVHVYETAFAELTLPVARA